MIDDNGYIEVGYIYTFIFSTILLSSIFFSVTKITGDKREEFAKEEFVDTLDRVVNSIEEASYLTIKSPNASFEKSIPLIKYTRDYKYWITVTNNMVYINSTDNEIKLKRNLECSVPCSGTISGDSETVKIIYQKDAKAIIVK